MFSTSPTLVPLSWFASFVAAGLLSVCSLDLYIKQQINYRKKYPSSTSVLRGFHSYQGVNVADSCQKWEVEHSGGAVPASQIPLVTSGSKCWSVTCTSPFLDPPLISLWLGKKIIKANMSCIFCSRMHSLNASQIQKHSEEFIGRPACILNDNSFSLYYIFET